ncbi:hypothetical protein AXK11_08185 [Cephaloticoccus primus]|uniref:Uncharacterized protein n=1 Tax=Cephaloticoccus primus TaxID=1548207 RepID=A0A139SIU0_9BACT|nr:hypothetical protein [Cephaloticoccus primus]KXU34498.1 hypothetical protein AXK11_08185 [Cephaloticoccus primus]
MKHPAQRLRPALAIATAAALSAVLALGVLPPSAHAQNAVTRLGDSPETTSKPTLRGKDGESAAANKPPANESPTTDEPPASSSQRLPKADESPASAPPAKRAPDEPPTSALLYKSISDEPPTSGSQNKSVPDAFDAFPQTAVKKPIRGRAVSPSVAAQLAARMPKYEEPKPAAETEPEEEPADLRDIDKPQNQILRLPDYVVREKKPAILREADLYQGEARAELAKARYFSETGLALNRFALPLFGSGAGAYALRRYEEDERLRHLGELSATASDIGQLSGSTETEADLRHLIRDTYFRSGSRSDEYNGYRKPD